MSITQIITSAPDSPSRATPSTFADKADASVAWQEGQSAEQNTWATQANNLATEMEGFKDDAETAETGAETAQIGAEAAESSAEEYRDAAAAIANATVYSASTTYAGGAVVQDSDDSYTLYISQADDNAGNTPHSDDGTWWERAVAKWEREEITSSSDITLTNSSANVQDVTMTASGNKVILPDATTLSLGDEYIIYQVDKEFTVNVGDVTLAFMQGHMAVMFKLRDNTEADGKWGVVAIDRDSLRISQGEIWFNDNSTYQSCDALTPDKYIACCRDEDNSDLGRCAVISYDESTGELIAGSDVIFQNSDIKKTSVTAMTDTRAIVAYVYGASASHVTRLLISGTSVTAFSSSQFCSGVVNSVSSERVSDTQVILFYIDPGDNKNYARLLTWVSSLTQGSPVEVLASTTASEIASTRTKDGKFIIFGRGTKSAQVITVSGDTITAGAEQSFTSTNINSNTLSACSVSDNQVVCCFCDSYYMYASSLSISGTSLTLEQEDVRIETGRYGSSMKLARIGEGIAVCTFYSNIDGYEQETKATLLYVDENSNISIEGSQLITSGSSSVLAMSEVTDGVVICAQTLTNVDFAVMRRITL